MHQSVLMAYSQPVIVSTQEMSMTINGSLGLTFSSSVETRMVPLHQTGTHNTCTHIHNGAKEYTKQHTQHWQQPMTWWLTMQVNSA